LACQIGNIPAEMEIDSKSVEITETIVMAHPQRSILVLSELKALGVHLSIDDFGTAYSSLSRLQEFPVDTLKIDHPFTSRMNKDSETSEIVRIMIMLAHNLDLKVVAKRAETKDRVSSLTQLERELAQGYFFALPGDHTEAQAFLLKHLALEAQSSPTAAM
jgi:EAL domain-containing protein (putative c-di-GMP-specific phosphodiesterase class I)